MRKEEQKLKDQLRRLLKVESMLSNETAETIDKLIDAKIRRAMASIGRIVQ